MFKIEGSIKDILKLLLILLLLVLAFIIRDIIALVFIAVILTSALNPIVDYLDTKKIPRPISVLGILVILLFLVFLLFNTLIPPLVSQTNTLLTSIPNLITDTIENLNLQRYLSNQVININNTDIGQGFIDIINNNSNNLLKFSTGVFNSLLQGVTVIVLTYYLLVEHGGIQEFFGNFFEGKSRSRFISLWGRVEQKLGVWLRGQITAMFIIGLASYIGLKILGLPFALPLAIIAGILEIIPIIGPIVSVIPAIIIALSTQSPIAVISVMVLYFIIQQLESVFVIPRVMQQAVGLNPILVILAIMVGSRLGGPIGALLSVPISAIFLIGYEEWKKITDKKRSSTPSPTPTIK